MAIDNLTQSASEFLGALTDNERKALAAFLEDETALYELKSHLPFGSIQLAAAALRNCGVGLMPTSAQKERRRMTDARMCLGKRAHRWKDQAQQHLERLLPPPGVYDPERLDIYACLYCWHWHVGHKPLTVL